MASDKVKFPWRVSVASKFGCCPTIAIVDPDGKVVARMTSGTLADAERIVRASNRAAENASLEEV